MKLQRHNGEFITLASELGGGGEGSVYLVARDHAVVAKIYHQPKEDHLRKLMAMLENPPADPMSAQGHVSIAWPTDLLWTSTVNRKFAGFLMPRVTGMRPIIEFFNPKARRQRCPLFNYAYLHRTARNLAAAVQALHTGGYVIGDVNESNILVSDTALVTLVDTDSFQVTNFPNGILYRCRVGKPEFTPPELQGMKFAEINRVPEHDLFGLSVVIFLLLMEGTHPFAGRFQGKGDAPSIEQRISAGHFVYAANGRVPYDPPPTAPLAKSLHPAVQQLFVQCFAEGHRNPRTRPDAQTWRSALEEAEQSLVECKANEQHLFAGHLRACPWCERAETLGGHDAFPSKKAVAHGDHIPLAQVALPQPANPRRKPRLIKNRRLHWAMAALMGLTFALGTFCFYECPRKKKIEFQHARKELPRRIRTGQVPSSPQNEPPVAAPQLDAFGVQLHLGNSCLEAGRYDEAENAFQEAIRLIPDDAQAWYRLGTTYEKQERFSDAEAAFQQALKFKPDAGYVWNDLGALYDRQGRKPEAEVAYAQAVALNPSNAEAWHNLGIAYFQREENSEGERASKQAIKLNPNDLVTWRNLAVAYSGQGRHSDAQVALQQIIRLDPDSPEAWNSLGLVYSAQGKDSAEEEAYKRAINKSDYASSWSELGIAHLQPAENPVAEAAFRQAIKLKPDFADAWYNLGLTYMKLGQVEKAREAVGRLKKLDPALSEKLESELQNESR